ncbi:pimeloyl-ACP methyl ester carboxylesterase [Pedobacter cryoconitis]|uniref:Pimeloyl-ACP methyl ester carboxylesterase n=1 Tax=Pedobacter cryoconitis TaxID=188932 RepID=A0A7W8ZIZ0_9SPHI|nr:alpha/beta hydrolase [Pedobacter cryoconitis]MBB5634818.1 pimeloyl-ACP methyl ester carboxylesterase [Pedobacter cryoconitis]MBB6272050.1 pimeloyl-ACP methyl ester carboxylesterase [Pedobacter cryoconitis]
MKQYRQIYQQAKDLSQLDKQAIDDLLWKLICYAPKMPLRLTQEELLNKAVSFQLSVTDTYFTGKELIFNGFKWGTGNRKILLTHGWSSKAADFSAIIEELLKFEDVEIIAFDAPGNGSSPAELSNLILYIESIKEIINQYGKPAIVIGHSLGAMANVIALQQAEVKPDLLISIAPVIKLKALFCNMMNSVNVPQDLQDNFFESFQATFQRPASDYDLDTYYNFDQTLNHWIAFDEDDKVVDSVYLSTFLKDRPWIKSENYKGAGHEKLIRHPPLLNDLIRDYFPITL